MLYTQGESVEADTFFKRKKEAYFLGENATRIHIYIYECVSERVCVSLFLSVYV